MASYFSSRSSFRSNNGREDVDPMTSMSGIGDVMLVFACGLMTALVVAWNLDLGQFNEVELGEEIEDVQAMEEEIESGGSTYVEKGTVYQDPTTGRYYLVEEGTDTGADVDTLVEDEEGWIEEDADADLGFDEEALDEESPDLTDEETGEQDAHV